MFTHEATKQKARNENGDNAKGGEQTVTISKPMKQSDSICEFSEYAEGENRMRWRQTDERK